MATNQLSTPVVDNDGEPRRRILRGLQDDVEDAPPELRDEVSELLFEGNYDDDEALLVRGDHSSILVPKCDNCLIYQNMCVTLMGSTSAMSEELRKLEKLEPACERFKKQLAESQIQIEESLQSEQVLKTRVATAEAEAAEAKEKYASLERDYDAMAKAAEEGKKHAHEANTWRVKYERTVEVSKKIQDKRKEDMAKFDKVLNLANGYCKEAVSLKENYKKVIGHLEKLAYAVQTYVPTVFELLKEAVSLPSFKTEAPAHLQVEAERLCSIDVKQAFKVGLDSLNLRLDSRSVMDDDDGMSLEVERLMGNFDASSLSPRPSASKKRAVGRRPTEAMLRKQRATPSPMVLPADRSKAQAEHSEPPSVQPQEPGADVDPVVPPQELVEPDAVLMDDEEADKLLELGAEAISMPTPRSARTASARGRGRGRGKKGAAARSSRDLAAPVSSANPEQIRKQYEEALASKLRRRDTTAEERPSTSAEVKHMSIHGKKMMSIREQQEAQMKVSIKDKVAMMKKKEEAERIRTLEDSDDERDSPSPEIGSEPVPKRTEKVSPTKSAMAGFSLAREDLLLSASPSPGTSVIEGEGGGADEEVEPSDVQPPAEQPTQEASAQEGNEDGSMDVESRPVDSTPKISQDGSSVSLELLEDLAMEGEVPFGCTGMEEVHFDKQVEDVAQSPESEPETEQEKEPEPLPEQEKEPEPEPEQEKEPEPLPEQENEPEPEPVSDLDIRHEEEVAVDQPAEEQLSAEDDQQMDDTPAVDMVEKIPSAENTDAVVDESALLPALVESSEAALASVDDMGETAGLQIDDGLPEEEAAVESGPGKEVVEEADAAPTAPTAMEIGNDEQAPELREEVPASASKEPELSGPVEEQCPVQEGAGEQAAEVVVSESSEPCSSSPIAKPKLAEDTKRALGFGRRLRVDLGDKLEPISGTPSPQGAEKRKSVDEGERISTDAQSSEGQEAMPSADVPATDRDLAMQLHAQLNPRSLRSRRDSEPSQIHIQHTLQPSGSKPVPAKQHGKAKESQQGIGETKQNENTQRPSGPKQTPTKQLGKTKEPQQQAGETSQNEDTQQPSGSDQLGKTKESQQQIVETNQNEDTQQPSGPKQTPAKQLGKAKESQQQLEETKQNEDTQQPSGSKQTPTKQLGKTKESQQEIEETKQNEDTQQPSGSKQTLAKQLGKTKESQQEIETKQNEDTQQPSGSKQTPGKQLGKTKEPQQKAVETSQNEDTQQPSGANQLGKTKESQQQIVEGKLNEDTQRPSGPKQTPTKQLGKTKEPQQQAVEAKQNESESGMDLFNDILAGARNVTSKEKEDGGKKAAMTKRILPVKKECPGAKWQPEKVLEKEEVSKSVAPSSAVESVKLPVSNNDTPVEPTPVSGDTRAPSAAESSEALESTSLPTPRRTTRSCVAEHPRQSHVSSTPSRKPAAKPVEPVTPKEGAAETKSKSESAKKTTVTSSLPQKTPTAPKRESVLSPVRQTRARAEKAESTTDSTSSGPPSRVTSRTGPVAPKKRRVEQETVSEEEPTSSIAAPTSSLEDSDDEERLCVVEEGEIVEKEKAQDEQPQAHVDDDEEERLIVVESDEEDRLVLDDGQDSEEETSVVTRSKAGASVEAAVEKSKAEKPTKSKSGGTTAATTTLRTLPERSACVSTRRAHSTEDNAHVSTKASASRQTPRNVGALEAAKRSVSDFKAGPAAMEKFNATLSKQLRGRGRPPKNAPMPMRASSKGEEASRASASGETPPAPKKVEQKASAAATPQRTPSTSTRQSKMLQEAPPDTPSSRGVKRSAGVSAEAVHPVKRPQPGDSSVDRLLSGALMSEQKIEVIRKSLGERLNEIAQLSPHVFASVMLTISRSLPSGDLWTIVQMNFRNCDSSDIHNTREEKFLQNCRDLGCGERIWLEYVKRLAVMIATQDPNPLHTGRYFRLLIRALHYTGSLLSPAEKKAYLRPVLTKVFKTDMNVAVKATIYILLSPYYELLEWMKDANDPVSMLISIAIMTSQMDGKVLIWAWFQQFSEELPLHEVSPVTVRKAFDELVTKLDKLAVKRSTAMKQVPPSDEELEVISMAVAYLSPGNGQPVELRQILVQLVTDCLKRVKHALNPRALGGEKAWSEAYMVHNRLDLFIGLSVAAVLRKDDMTLQHDVRDLLQNETPSIREVASEVKKTTSSERPWLNIYQIAMTNAVQILKLFTQYEI